MRRQVRARGRTRGRPGAKRPPRAQGSTRFSRQCLYCLPCPQGVNIWLLRITRRMQCPWPREDCSATMGPFVEGARNRTQHGEREPKCPYGLPIRELIAENIAFYERVSA